MPGGMRKIGIANVNKRLKVRKTDENTVYVVKTEKFISPEEMESIKSRLQHAKEIRRHHKKKKIRKPRKSPEN